MADELTLGDFLQGLLRRWKTAVLVAAAVVAGATLYAESLPSQYESTVVVSFAPRPNSDADSNTVRLILPKYVEYVTARATINRVAPAVGEDAAAVAQAVDASIAFDSGNLTVKVRLPSPTRAAALANALATDTLRFADSDQLLSAVVVAPALAPSEPAGPPRRLLEAAALVVGLLLGAAAAFLLERGRARLRTWREIALVTGYPVVGRVPPSRALRSSTSQALSDPEVGAAVRTLRTNLEHLSREQPVHVLVVTSSVPGEGKTTLAGALAMALARLDAEVLLLDGDLRRPGVARLFSLNGTKGTAAVLRGRVTLDECLQKGPAPGLQVVPTTQDTEAGDLLARNFADVLRDARKRFDVVVVDAPPILGADDARTLATLCDGVLMVVAADTLVSSVSEAVVALDGLGVRVLGAVANRVRRSRLGAYGAYGAYGSYSERRT